MTEKIKKSHRARSKTMEQENYVAKEFFKKMYSELLEEIKKDEYKDTYVWDYIPLMLDNNIYENIGFVIETNNCGVYIFEHHMGSLDIEYSLEEFKEIYIGLIDFEKWEKYNDLEHSLNDLINDKIILDKEKFLKVYMKENNMCLLKDIDLKKLNVEQCKTLYFDTVLADVRWQDKIEKYL